MRKANEEMNSEEFEYKITLGQYILDDGLYYSPYQEWGTDVCKTKEEMERMFIEEQRKENLEQFHFMKENLERSLAYIDTYTNYFDELSDVEVTIWHNLVKEFFLRIHIKMQGVFDKEENENE